MEKSNTPRTRKLTASPPLLEQLLVGSTGQQKIAGEFASPTVHGSYERPKKKSLKTVDAKANKK
jgi:hypothetical protein